MNSSDTLAAILYDTGGLCDVMEADTRLDLHIRNRLTAMKAKYAADSETTQQMDMELGGYLKDALCKVRT